MGIWSKGRKAAGALVAAVLMTVSLATVVYAIKASVDTPQKDVLMIEEEGGTYQDQSATAAELWEAHLRRAAASPVKEDQAIQIARNSFSQMFGAEAEELVINYAMYYDQQRVKEHRAMQDYPEGTMIWETLLDRPFWNISLMTTDFEASSQGRVYQGQVYFATIDAATGDILSVHDSYSSSAADAPAHPISEEQAEQQTIDFIEAHDLAKGIAIDSIQSSHTETHLQVIVGMEDGENKILLFDQTSGQLHFYQGQVYPSLYLDWFRLNDEVIGSDSE